MIQATDLRIGNWVNNDDLGNTQVDEIYNNSVVRVWSNADYFYIGEESINPIPLTPDILEKCGFEKTNVDGGNKIISAYSLGTLMVVPLEKNDIWYVAPFGYPVNWRHSRYLHQLQNLYKALTNDELTINLTK